MCGTMFALPNIVRRQGLAIPDDTTMAKRNRVIHKWIIVLIAFDEDGLEPQVLKERIPAADDEQLAALLRGGEVVALLDDDSEDVAEGYRREIEKECIR